MAKITIFGLAGTGTSTAGKILADKLSYQFFSSGDMMRQIAKDKGIELSDLHKLAKDDPEFDQKVDEKLRALGHDNDNIVVESRLAWYFIPDSIKLKLSCDLGARIARVAGRDKLPIEEARAQVNEREKADDERYKNLYGIEDIANDTHFDHIVDTTSNLPPQVVEQIMEFLENKNVKEV